MTYHPKNDSECSDRPALTVSDDGVHIDFRSWSEIEAGWMLRSVLEQIAMEIGQVDVDGDGDGAIYAALSKLSQIFSKAAKLGARGLSAGLSRQAGSIR